jgi:NAD(P)-dependent dehydrogenase (short-subunit alcohol dehydrogenase family)
MNTKKIALVTGANKGIGLETARQLAKHGITVLAGARGEAKASQRQPGGLEYGSEPKID